MIDSGSTVDILVKVYQFGMFRCKNVRVADLYKLKTGYYNQIFLLADDYYLIFKYVLAGLSHFSHLVFFLSFTLFFSFY